MGIDQNESIKTRVRSALESLGVVSQQVAGSLRLENIRGSHGADSCPIARYLRKLFPEYRFSALSTDVSVYRDDIATAYVDTPHAVRRFIEDYDNHLYPQLEEGSGL